MTVDVFLTCRYAKFLSSYPEEELRDFFSFHPPGYQYSPAFRYRGWNGKICMLRRGVLPAGLFRVYQKELEDKFNLKFKVTTSPESDLSFRPSVSFDRARKYQVACYGAMRDASAAGGGLVLGATGSGKTFTAGMYFACLRGAGCFVVDDLHLLEQSRQELAKVIGEDVGMIGNQVFDPRRVTVATVQTLARHVRDPRFNEWSNELAAVMIDEVHTAMNRSNFKVIESYLPPVVFGLTATLELKKKHVRYKAYALCGPVVFEYPLEQGVEEGYLTKGIAVQLRVPAPVETGDYQADYNNLIVDNYSRNNVIEGLVREARKRKKYVVVLVERVAHVKLLSKRLLDIPHRIVYGQKAVSQRMASKELLESGKVRVLIANKVFKKGIDLKRVDLLIDAAALKSKNDTIQKYGRGIRLHDEKDYFTYIDIADQPCPVGKKKPRFAAAAVSRCNALKSRHIPVLTIQVHALNVGPEVFDSIEAFARKTFDPSRSKPRTRTIPQTKRRDAS